MLCTMTPKAVACITFCSSFCALHDRDSNSNDRLANVPHQMLSKSLNFRLCTTKCGRMCVVLDGTICFMEIFLTHATDLFTLYNRWLAGEHTC